jgi:hypothetical protein
LARLLTVIGRGDTNKHRGKRVRAGK